MEQMTTNYGVNLDAFNRIIFNLMEDMGQEETSREHILRKKFERKDGYEALREKFAG